MGAISVALLLLVFALAAKAQGTTASKEDPLVTAVCSGAPVAAPVAPSAPGGNRLLVGGTFAGETPTAIAFDPRPWVQDHYALAEAAVSPDAVCWTGMSPKQNRLMQTFVAEFNRRNRTELSNEEVGERLGESKMATIVSITYAMEHTLITGARRRTIGQVSDYIEAITDVLGADPAHPDDRGDIQFRIYVRLRAGATAALRESREFGPPGHNTFGHKDYPLSFRERGGMPSLQISTDKKGEKADIDIDYRSKNPFAREGHMHPSNSDVRSNRLGICNYKRFLRRWPGWRKCRKLESGMHDDLPKGTGSSRTASNFALSGDCGLWAAERPRKPITRTASSFVH